MLAQIDAGEAGRPARPERREGKRHRLMMRVVKLRVQGGEYACVMHDVSESGARLRLFHEHPSEDFMFVELSNGEIYAIERRWTDGDFAGFRFSSAVDIRDFLHERSEWNRRPVRLNFQHPAMIAAAGERSHAMLVNISAQGACVEAGRQVPVGQMIRLEAGEMPSRLGHVCWRRGYTHGIVFQEAIPLGDFARHAFALQPYQAEPRIDEAAIEAARVLVA